MKKVLRAADATCLQHIPNIGPRTAADLHLLGITTPQQLISCDPVVLYDRLCSLTGQRHDPCVLDVFRAAVDFMRGAPARPWWAYSHLRSA